MAPLDLAPYKALRWQRRRLVAAPGADGLPAPCSQQAALALGSQQGLCGTQASGSGRLEEQWEDEPHVMVLFQAGLLFVLSTSYLLCLMLKGLLCSRL